MTSNNDTILSRVEAYLLLQKELYGTFVIDIKDDTIIVDSSSDVSVSPKFNKIRLSDSTLKDPAVHNQTRESDQNEIHTTVKIQSMIDILHRDPNLLEINSLNDLEAYCATLDLLKTDLPDTRMVFGKGNAQADLMLIGEAPGAEEDRLGEPFVGRSGQLLTKILEAINISRDDVYIANILKHRPPDNRNPLPEERERSLPYLLKQIELISPRIILCLGKVPTETLLQTKSSLTSLRGKFHTFMDRYEVLLTYHPAYLLRDPNKKRDTWEDVKLLRKRYDELGCKP